MTDEFLLASVQRASVIAPAGYGKTELILKAAALAQDLPALVLTHTHAGINALRARMGRLGIPSGSVSVETLHGFSLRWASRYSRVSGLDVSDPSGKLWDQVLDGALRVLSCRFAAQVLRNSYSCLFVDEYQDCSLQQHYIVMLLAEALPTKVLGDPLQGIFGFAGPCVNWDRDVSSNFPPLQELTTPWRWRNKNEDLAYWLSDCRLRLRRNEKIDLRMIPPKAAIWRQVASPSDLWSTQDDALRRVRLGDEESVAGLLKFRTQCYTAVERLGGLYTALEEMDLSGLARYAEAIDDQNRFRSAGAILGLARDCYVGLSDLGALIDALAANRTPSRKNRKKHLNIVALVESYVSTGSRKVIFDLFDECSKAPEAVCIRRELRDEASRALRLWVDDPDLSFADANAKIRDVTRRIGRRSYRRSVGTPLLLKGLEFDHAVVLDGAGLSREELYVAMTRATSSLTILSSSPLIG